MRGIAAGMEQKLWDCDLEATRASYRAQLEGYTAGSGDVDRDYYWTYYYSRHRGQHGQYYRRAETAAAEVENSMPNLKSTFGEFRSSAVCYEGAFANTACHDACHSACHDACHSACHSACHGACHSACVSSGH